PARQYLGVDRPEVHCERQAAVIHRSEVRHLPLQTGCDRSAAVEHHARIAVLSAVRAILRQLAAEIRERQEQHALELADRAQMIGESAQSLAELAVQQPVLWKLVDVRVERRRAVRE